MGEPSLTCGNPQRTFRFLWHRSFHSSFAVRVEISDDQARLYAVELEIATKDDSDPIGRRLEKALDPEELGELKDAFTRTKFWSIKTTPREANMDGRGLDGSQWLIEGVENGRHHSAARWSPKEGPIRELGLLFSKFTGWKFEENEIY